MAYKIIPEGKHAVVEINKLEARTTGAMVADKACATALDNGQVVSYTTTSITTSTSASDDLGTGLVFSTEHIYDERARDLGSFYTPAGKYPRVYQINKTDVITTNAITITSATDYATAVSAVEALTGPVMLARGTDGFLTTTTTTTAAIAEGVKSTLPNGDVALKVYFK